MGSNGQIYLYPNLEDCYVISRNGYRYSKITHEQIKPVFDKYQGKYKDLLVLNTEVMPWSAIGKGLIDKSFKPYYTAITNQLDMISESEIMSKIPGFNLDQERSDIEAYGKQVDIYGADNELYFEIFDVVYCDGQEYLTGHKPTYLKEFDIPFKEFNLESEDECKQFVDYYNDMVSPGNVEGIVVKPSKWSKSDIPMIKVRNAEYLRIIYGHDYLQNISRFIAKKDIRGKLSLSIKEQNINLDLIKAYKEDDETLMKNIYKAIVVEFAKEKTLDPRL